jgi:hypothetical protein
VCKKNANNFPFFRASQPASQPARQWSSERESGELITAPERRWSGPPLYTLSMPVLAMNESTEWLQITIITKVPFYLHTQTDRPLSPRTEWEHKRRERHAPQLRLCAPRAKIEATDEEREAGRQAGSEGGRKGGRESSEREGVGISGGPRRWVVRWAALPRSCCLFRACVRAG